MDVFGPGTIEYPEHWVARMHVVLPAARATRFVITHDTLDGLRTILPPGLTCFPRHPNDPPHLWRFGCDVLRACASNATAPGRSPPRW